MIQEHKILPIDVMYNQMHRLNTVGLDSYDFEKKYFDPKAEIQKRKLLTSRKGQRSNKHITKRGHYLEDLHKITMNTPAPGQYPPKDQWKTQRQKSLKILTNRHTYLDVLIKQASKDKIPAPGQYNVTKTQAQIQAQTMKLKLRKPGERHNTTYLDEIEYASSRVPGPGAYNPRKVRSKPKLNNTKPDDWRKKAIKQSKKKTERSPSPVTYNPRPATYQLFQSTLGIKPKPSLVKLWGKQKRFVQQPKKKKEIGPGQYDLWHHWKGKHQKKGGIPKLKDCLEAVSKPTSKSVYY